MNNVGKNTNVAGLHCPVRSKNGNTQPVPRLTRPVTKDNIPQRTPIRVRTLLVSAQGDWYGFSDFVSVFCATSLPETCREVR